MGRFNKHISVWVGSLIIIACVLLTGGVLVWQFNLFGKESKTTGVNFPTKTKLPKEAVSSGRIIGSEIIPVSIVKDYEKLKEFLIEKFLIENKICEGSENCKNSLEYEPDFYTIREDLNADGKEEVIVGLGLENTGRIGLLVDVGQGYKIVDWIDVELWMKSMELRKLPNKDYWSVVVKTGGGAGTGIAVEEMRVYTYINNRLKLTWRGYIEYNESEPNWRIVENTYYIHFIDIDRDGNIDIVQEGTEKEGKEYDERGNLIPAKETWVENVFKWNEKEKLFTKF